MAIKGARGILPINPVALQQVSKTITKGAVTDIKSGLLKVGDNVKSAVGDLLSGNIFQDDSGHGHPHSIQGSNGKFFLEE